MLSASHRYVYEDVDRHGNVRVYFWRGKGHPKIRIRASVGSAEFAAAYEAAAASVDRPSAILPYNRLEQPIAGTYRWLCVECIKSAEFRQLDPRTQRERRAILETTYEETTSPGSDQIFAMVPVREITPLAIRVLRDRKAHVPDGANNRLQALRRVFNWALQSDLKGVSINPARNVPYLKRTGSGWHSWSIEEIQQFEKRHAIGTRARLALALLIYTGVRRSDVVRLGRQHVRAGWLRFTTAKNAARRPIKVEIPILPALQKVLDQSPVGDLTFLVTERGQPFTLNGFSNKMRQWCNEAELPHCSAHGLRKASASIAAENGATEDQLMAIFGWLRQAQAAHYTKGARRKTLAGDAMKLLVRRR
jgi:integrase